MRASVPLRASPALVLVIFVFVLVLGLPANASVEDRQGFPVKHVVEAQRRPLHRTKDRPACGVATVSVGIDPRGVALGRSQEQALLTAIQRGRPLPAFRVHEINCND